MATSVKAGALLRASAGCVTGRAPERDKGEERSMVCTVKAFNAMFNKDLTEEQGWQFMVLLKMSRSKAGHVKLDDYVDEAGYAALAAEAAQSERGQAMDAGMYEHSQGESETSD